MRAVEWPLPDVSFFARPRDIKGNGCGELSNDEHGTGILTGVGEMLRACDGW
jgi:hypothetical protein